jgi:hypothetical protein
MNSEIVARALLEVKPAPASADLCRQEIVGMLRYTPAKLEWEMHAYPSKVDRQALKNVAKGLEKTMGAIASLSPGWRQKLFVIQFPQPAADKRAAFFRKVAEWLAERAMSFARDPAVNIAWRKTFRKGNPRKKLAAMFAYEILEQFGDRQPTLTASGAFFNLAQIFYEATGGSALENLDRQCRAVHRALSRRRNRR